MVRETTESKVVICLRLGLLGHISGVSAGQHQALQLTQATLHLSLLLSLRALERLGGETQLFGKLGAHETHLFLDLQARGSSPFSVGGLLLNQFLVIGFLTNSQGFEAFLQLLQSGFLLLESVLRGASEGPGTAGGG